MQNEYTVASLYGETISGAIMRDDRFLFLKLDNGDVVKLYGKLSPTEEDLTRIVLSVVSEKEKSKWS